MQSFIEVKVIRVIRVECLPNVTHGGVWVTEVAPSSWGRVVRRWQLDKFASSRWNFVSIQSRESFLRLVPLAHSNFSKNTSKSTIRTNCSVGLKQTPTSPEAGNRLARQVDKNNDRGKAGAQRKSSDYYQLLADLIYLRKWYGKFAPHDCLPELPGSASSAKFSPFVYFPILYMYICPTSVT